MVTLNDSEFPEHLLYDIENQIWYLALDDGTVRAGFTAWSAKLMGDVLVFTPKRLGRDFEKGRSFAVVEGGKWVGSARAAFDGIVTAHNEALMRQSTFEWPHAFARLDAHAEDFLNRFGANHIHAVPGDVRPEMRAVCRLLNITLDEFTRS